MAKFSLFSTLAAALAVLLISCDKIEGPDDVGTLELSFSDEYRLLQQTSKSVNLPDTNNFILGINDSSGQVVYKGKFGDSPQKITAAPGSYTINIVSREFDEPVYDSPQYGDTRVVEISQGKTNAVKLECTQMNAGIKLEIDSDFLEYYRDGTLFLRSSDGSLMFGYSEKRTAYFKPGAVSLVLNVNDNEKTLFTRMLSAKEILTVRVSMGSSSLYKDGIHVVLDTTTIRHSETFILGSSDKGDSKDNALSANEALSCSEKQNVWVYGYIVGGDLTSSKCSFQAPFTSKTNIVLATRSSCRDRSACLSVQLSTGDARETLNLVDHPDNLGKQVFLKGNLVSSYYGIPGIRNITEFDWK